MSQNGKGDAPRPLSVSAEEFAANWQAIFHPARNRVCERCGKPDREVEIGFILCRPCFDMDLDECPTCGGSGHGDAPKGRSKRYPACEKCGGTGRLPEAKEAA